MNYLPEFFTIALIHLLAVMSPGPDFILISRNSLVYSRRTGIYSSIGLALGIATHVLYSIVGIGFIIAQSIVVFSTIKFLGAGYLIYIGYKALKSKPSTTDTTVMQKAEQDISVGRAIRLGYLTNILNPKATLFFLSLFTQVIDPATPLLIQIGYGLEMCLMTFAWFSLVALALSHARLKHVFSRVQRRVDKVFGVILIALGIKIATGK